MRSLLLLLLACDSSGEPENTAVTLHTDNPTYDVTRLFTADGCTVYRFYSKGSYRYFTRCESGTVETQQGDDCTTTTQIVGGKSPHTVTTTTCEDAGTIPTKEPPNAR